LTNRATPLEPPSLPPQGRKSAGWTRTLERLGRLERLQEGHLAWMSGKMVKVGEREKVPIPGELGWVRDCFVAPINVVAW